MESRLCFVFPCTCIFYYNTEKRPANKRRFAGTQTPGENHLLTLVWKTHEWVKKNNNSSNNNILCSSCWPQSKFKRKWKREQIPRPYPGTEKILWNMKVTFILIIIGALGTVTKGLIKWLEELEIKGRVETILNYWITESARILRRVLETWGDLLSLRLQWMIIS